MSTMKSGFSTLNRWLGKKNKDKNAVPNGKLSKSSTNLNMPVTATEISEPSQLEYNRITPLPAVTSNAPFEQTFRITVLLPKDQLYVTRLGARLPLSTLLKMVCDNKLLDQQKYEFRNPVDASQVYGNELTIGSVGLSEVRLCHKSDSYENFNTDEVIKMHRTTVMRESLSSSEYSSRNSKHATNKTTSPYSSSNSLNSMDSAGVNYTRTPISPPPPALPNTVQPKMMAPPRKKRAAPRPPSQTIPERSALILENGNTENAATLTNGATSPSERFSSNGNIKMSHKDYYVSTPDLAMQTALLNGDPQTPANSPIDCNGNMKAAAANDSIDNVVATANGDQVVDKNARNLYGGSVQNLSSYQTPEQTQKFPEPSPRRRLLNIKKKSAPAPPPGQRNSMYSEDTISIASTVSTSGGNSPYPETPQSLPMQQPTSADFALRTHERTIEHEIETPPSSKVTSPTGVNSVASTPLKAPPSPVETPPPVRTCATPPQAPKPVPRSTTMTLLNATPATASAETNSPSNPQAINNISKVILNRTPTPEPRSLSTEPPMDVTPEVSLTANESHMSNITAGHEDNDDNVSKQADSGIGEPIPSPLPDSLPSEGSTHEKSTFESSSDDDDMVKVYNFKLGKTTIKPMCDARTLEDLTTIAGGQSTDESGTNTPGLQSSDDLATPVPSETTSWNFSIPISPPPNFADTTKSGTVDDSSDKLPDMPITPKIKQRPVLNFESFVNPKEMKATPSAEITEKSKPRPANLQNLEVARPVTPLPSPTAPLNEILQELNSIISEKGGVDTLKRRHDEQPDIESAKPNTLSNFSIATISQQPSSKPIEIQIENSINDEQSTAQSKWENTTTTTRTVMRADSFHTTSFVAQLTPTKSSPQTNGHADGMTSRSSSYMSLTKIEQNGLHHNRRRSSSELSIGESPSLQSPEVIKTILNSRKNSLANSSDSESTGSNNKTITAEIITQLVERAVESAPPQQTLSPIEVTKEPKMKSAGVETSPQALAVKQADIIEDIPTAAVTTTAATAVNGPSDSPTPKELPKVYRYSGPPSINFSTWSERPKVQVAIKNEGDYIFGGKIAGNTNAAVTTATVDINTQSMPRNYRASMPAQAHAAAATPSPPAVPPKPDTVTQRMGIPERDFRVPITVKPLKDVTVDSVNVVASRTDVVEGNTSTTTINTVTINRQTTVETKSPAQAKTTMNIEQASVLRPQAQTYNSSTLPRTHVTTHRLSMPAQASTTKLSLAKSSQEATTNTKGTNQAESPITAAPFGQNTLRKTGLKNILAKEEAVQQKAKINGNAQAKSVATSNDTITKSTFNNVSTTPTVATKSTTVVIRTQNSGGHSEPPNPVNNRPATAAKPLASATTHTRTLQSAKLELKLQTPMNGYAAASPSPSPSARVQTAQATTTTTATPATVYGLSAKRSTVDITPTTPKTAPILGANTPAPPPPPAWSSASNRKPVSKSAGSTPTNPQADPRDALLDAIRNFKRNELNRT